MLTGTCLHEIFVAMVAVGGHDCLERKLLIRQEQMKAGVATLSFRC